MCIHFMGEQFTFSALTFQPKQFSAVYLYGVQKWQTPHFNTTRKLLPKALSILWCQQIYCLFFIDFQADRPATLIFLRDHRGWPWLLRKDFLSNRNLYSEWKLSPFCKNNTFFLLVIAALTICDWFQEIIYGGVLFHRLCQWYFLLHFLNFIEKISCRTATIVSSSEFFGSVPKR